MGPGKTPTEDIFTLNNYFKILEAQLKEKYIDFLVFFLMKASLTRMAQCNPTILYTQLTEGILRSNACYCLMKSHRAPCIQIPAPSPHSHLPHIQTHVRSPVFPVPVH